MDNLKYTHQRKAQCTDKKEKDKITKYLTESYSTTLRSSNARAHSPWNLILWALVYKRALCPSASFEGYLKDMFFSAVFKNHMLVTHHVFRSSEEVKIVLVQPVQSYHSEERQCTSPSNLLHIGSRPTMNSSVVITK